MFCHMFQSSFILTLLFYDVKKIIINSFPFQRYHSRSWKLFGLSRLEGFHPVCVRSPWGSSGISNANQLPCDKLIKLNHNLLIIIYIFSLFLWKHCWSWRVVFIYTLTIPIEWWSDEWILRPEDDEGSIGHQRAWFAWFLGFTYFLLSLLLSCDTIVHLVCIQ